MYVLLKITALFFIFMCYLHKIVYNKIIVLSRLKRKRNKHTQNAVIEGKG